MKICNVLAIGFCLFLSGANEGAHKNPDTLVIRDNVLAELRLRADTLKTEVVFCLRGSVYFGRAYVSGFSEPTMRVSKPSKANAEKCPTGTIASWHNHPNLFGATDSRRLCVLSDTDIKTAHDKKYQFVVVFVDAHTACWWSRNAVRQAVIDPESNSPLSPEYLIE